MTNFTVPGLTAEQGSEVAQTLQNRLSAYNDLHLTLKHIHWNVVGPNFIGVHEMIDPQVELVRGYADAAAERIAALGASPKGTRAPSRRTVVGRLLGRPRQRAGPPRGARPGLHRTDEDNRKAIGKVGEIDPITEDMLIGQTAELEKFQWFVRANLENSGGQLANEGEPTEEERPLRPADPPDRNDPPDRQLPEGKGTR